MSHDALQEMRLYRQFFPQEAEKISDILLRLDGEGSGADIFDRARLPGHVTASGIVLDQGKVLLIHHPFLNIWIPPGGHVDAGEDARSAAIREVLEETGISTRLHEWHAAFAHPLDIDLHVIPANPVKQELEHWHCDFRYILQSVGQSADLPELDCRWVALDEAGSGRMQRVREKLRSILSVG